jgi:hypothetical protein
VGRWGDQIRLLIKNDALCKELKNIKKLVIFLDYGAAEAPPIFQTG